MKKERMAELDFKVEKKSENRQKGDEKFSENEKDLLTLVARVIVEIVMKK